MLYQRPKFTLPASHRTDEKTWDMAFLSKEDFEAKHGKDSYSAAVPQADGFSE